MNDRNRSSDRSRSNDRDREQGRNSGAGSRQMEQQTGGGSYRPDDQPHQRSDMSRQPGDESMDLETPTFLFPVQGEGEGEPELWTMHSDRAWISPEGDEVRLVGDVRADGPGADGMAASMRTERLDVFPRDERAESDERVTVSNGGSIIHSGRGLRMDLANRHYQFLSDVEFRYVPDR